MQPTSKRLPFKKLLILLVVLLLIIGGYYAYTLSQFRVVSTNPKTSAVSYHAPFLKIKFSRQLSNKDLSIASSPDIIESQTLSGNELSLTLRPLKLDKTYTVTLHKITATDGSVIENKVLRFAARDIAFNDLPSDQQQALIDKQNKAPKASNDPIFNYLPHQTPSYSLSALLRASSSSNPSGLYLHAEIMLSNAEQGSSDVAAIINQHEQEVRDYVSSVGLDPSKYVFEFDVNGGSTP
jgi:hypothetical protein